MAFETGRALADNGEPAVFGVSDEVLADAVESVVPHFLVDGFGLFGLQELLD